MSVMEMHRQFSHFLCRNWVEDHDGIDVGTFFDCFLTATSLLQAGNKTFERGVAEGCAERESRSANWVRLVWQIRRM